MSVRDFSEAYARREVRRAYMWGGGLLLLALLVTGAGAATEFNLATLFGGLGRAGDFFASAMPTLTPDALLEDRRTEGSLLYWLYDWRRWLVLMAQTLEMAALATALGGAGALVLSFLAAAPTSPHPAVLFLTRRALELFRTIPDIVLALVLVFAVFGVGPPAGVIAIAVHTAGALGKLFTEVIENIDLKPLEGVRAAGGSRFDEIRFGALPQVAPNFASYGLLRVEINVASASAIGFVGAGGIGEVFLQAINRGAAALPDAFAIMLMVVLVIFCIDLASEALRVRLQGHKA